MLMSGDFDLNSSQRYADSLREALKETMLNQELVFKKQVHDLHRLYMTQKSLMDDLSWKELNHYNSWKATTQLTPELHASSIGYNMAEARTFSSMPLVESTRSIDQGMSGECLSSYSKDQHRLPAKHYVRRVDDDFRKREHAWNSPLVVNNYSLVGDNVSDSGEVNHSLHIGEDTRKKELGITWFGKKTYPCSQEVIDLEESIERLSNKGDKSVLSYDFAAPATYSRNEQDLQVHVLSNSLFSKCEKKDPTEVITLVDGCGSSPERSSLNPGPLECHDDLPCENLLTKKQRLTSSGARHIDLNKVQFDDSSCYSNDPLMVYPLTASSSIALHKAVGESVEGTCGTPTCSFKIVSKCSNGTSDIHQQNRSFNHSLVGSDGKDNIRGVKDTNAKCKEYCGTVMGYIDLESVSGSPLDLCENPCSCRRNLENENTGLPLESSNSILYDQSDANVVTTQLNLEGSKMQGLVSSFPYQSQVTVQAALCSYAGDNNSSSEKIMQSGIQLGDLNISASNDFSEIPLGSEVAETAPGEQDLRSCHSSELKQQCYSKKEESPELDVLIKKAAESLVSLSLESSVCYPDCASKAGSKEMEIDKEEQPEYSCDTYESIVLKLTENSVDDCSITSKPFEINEMEKKDFGIKLKRGRRMKDFQRDILPGLASLSRQEIREDINIMEGVIRSREYRKIRAKMGDVGNWSTPVRSRRSRRHYIGRRN